MTASNRVGSVLIGASLSGNGTMMKSKSTEAVTGTYTRLGIRLASGVLRVPAAATILMSAQALYAAPSGSEMMARADKHDPATVDPVPNKRVVSSLAAAQPLPPPTAAEKRCGVQVLRATVAAAGGLVDLRLKILDAAKARKRIMDPAHPPLLIPEGSGMPLKAARDALKNLRFVDGAANYILYPNVRGAVKPGSKVVLALADQRLDPIRVQ